MALGEKDEADETTNNLPEDQINRLVNFFKILMQAERRRTIQSIDNETK